MTATGTWKALKVGVWTTVGSVVVSGIALTSSSWLGVGQQLSSTLAGAVGVVFAIAAVFTWFAGMANCLKRPTNAPGRRAIVFVLLVIGNFVGAIVYLLVAGPPPADA